MDSDLTQGEDFRPGAEAEAETSHGRPPAQPLVAVTLGGLAGVAAVIPGVMAVAMRFDYLVIFWAGVMGICGVTLALSGWAHRRTRQVAWVALQAFAAGSLVFGATFGLAFGGLYLLPSAALGTASVFAAVVPAPRTPARRASTAVRRAPLQVVGFVLVAVGGMTSFAGIMLFAYQLLVLGGAIEAAAALALLRHYMSGDPGHRPN